MGSDIVSTMKAQDLLTFIRLMTYIYVLPHS